MTRTRLTLRPAPAHIQKPPPPVPADPVKIALSHALGLRFISKSGRYILQTRMVTYHGELQSLTTPRDTTWIDIPLVPEVYG